MSVLLFLVGRYFLGLIPFASATPLNFFFKLNIPGSNPILLSSADTDTMKLEAKGKHGLCDCTPTAGCVTPPVGMAPSVLSILFCWLPFSLLMNQSHWPCNPYCQLSWCSYPWIGSECHTHALRHVCEKLRAGSAGPTACAGLTVLHPGAVLTGAGKAVPGDTGGGRDSWMGEKWIGFRKWWDQQSRPPQYPNLAPCHPGITLGFLDFHQINRWNRFKKSHWCTFPQSKGGKYPKGDLQPPPPLDTAQAVWSGCASLGEDRAMSWI